MPECMVDDDYGEPARKAAADCRFQESIAYSLCQIIGPGAGGLGVALIRIMKAVERANPRPEMPGPSVVYVLQHDDPHRHGDKWVGSWRGNEDMMDALVNVTPRRRDQVGAHQAGSSRPRLRLPRARQVVCGA